MSTSQILITLWRRRLIFSVTFILVMATAALITFNSPKVYTTVAYLIVSQSRPATSTFEATQVNEVLTRTYGELLQSRRIAEDVQKALPYQTSIDDLLSSVDVQAVSQSQLLSITAEGPSPRRAQLTADIYAGVFVRQARELTVASGNTAVINLAQSAAQVTEPTRPRPVLYLAIAGVLAVLLASALALLRQRLDQRLDVDVSTSHIFGISVIGYVPQRSGRADSRSARQSEEAFRLVLANLAFANGGRRPSTLAVVSSGEREGKSTTSYSLARAAAELGISVLLVDGDLRRPTVAAAAESAGVDMSASPGLAYHLASGGSASQESLAVPFRDTSLSIVPSGHAPDAAALLSSQAFESFVNRVQDSYDLVIFDTPPLTIGPDASVIAALTSGAVFVVDARKTRRTEANRAIDQLRRTETKILGVVLNRTGDSNSSYYYGDRDRGRGNDAAEPVPAVDADGAARDSARAKTPGRG